MSAEKHARTKPLSIEEEQCIRVFYENKLQEVCNNFRFPCKIQSTIPTGIDKDELVWEFSYDDICLLKEAKIFLHGHLNELTWAKLIWRQNITPARTCLLWKLFRSEVSIDKNVTSRSS
ncbi:hypothetical protein Fmac_014250 [Flemingia macrophylla]|uniref:Reverse transcriptase zinc-binding domain-containing protein n=1 Tax=Flemingia macrophylla TaxID=520843 RepID=A0ABD1MBA5_9FABA